MPGLDEGAHEQEQDDHFDRCPRERDADPAAGGRDQRGDQQVEQGRGNEDERAEAFLPQAGQAHLDQYARRSGEGDHQHLRGKDARSFGQVRPEHDGIDDPRKGDRHRAGAQIEAADADDIAPDVAIGGTRIAGHQPPDPRQEDAGQRHRRVDGRGGQLFAGREIDDL